MYVTEHTAVMCNHEFEQLDDYSCSLPTGTRIGKMWKRRKDYHDETKGWLMGEYAELDPPRSNRVAIIWRTIEVDPTEAEWRSLIIDELQQYLKQYDRKIPNDRGIYVDSKKMKIIIKPKFDRTFLDWEFDLYDPKCFEQIHGFLLQVEQGMV